jgi:predicted kinase
MPTLIVLAGLPGSGKSTYVNQLYDEGYSPPHNTFYYSTDFYIENIAASKNLSYDQCFSDYIGEATQAMNSMLQDALRWKTDVIWDQTNMSDKKRRGILSRFNSSYRKICVCRVPPRNDEEWSELNRRIASREGKSIPSHIVESMARSYVEPSLGEGFNEVCLYDIYGNKL